MIEHYVKDDVVKGNLRLMDHARVLWMEIQILMAHCFFSQHTRDHDFPSLQYHGMAAAAAMHSAFSRD